MSARRRAAEQLPMIRMFIEVFPCVGVEVGEQLLDGREAVGRFLSAEMPVIACAGFIVVTQDTYLPIDQCYPVLIAVRATGQTVRCCQ